MAKHIELPDYCNRCYAEINLDAIVQNMIHMKEMISQQTKLMGVVKTDGYGHGSIPIAKALEPFEFMWGYAVATAEEAYRLRESGIRKPLLILGYSFPYCYETLAKMEIRPAVFRYDMIKDLCDAARKAEKRIKIHIKVDTGMGRIGITPDEEGLHFVEKIMNCTDLEIEGIFTHFARADETDKSSAENQLSVFSGFLHEIEQKLGLKIPMKHCSNSAGILEMPQANMDLVRAGITMYGLYPSNEVKNNGIDLKPALSLYSKIIYIKKVYPGQSISYGGTFTATSKMTVATVPVGYGEGYPRSLSGKGYVLIHGKKAKILGRICMDQFMVDITDIKEAKEGDRVVLIGYDGKEQISAEMLGDLSGRFNYELVCDLGKRIPRIFIRDNEIVDCCEYI